MEGRPCKHRQSPAVQWEELVVQWPTAPPEQEVPLGPVPWRSQADKEDGTVPVALFYIDRVLTKDRKQVLQ